MTIMTRRFFQPKELPYPFHKSIVGKVVLACITLTVNFVSGFCVICYESSHQLARLEFHDLSFFFLLLLQERTKKKTFKQVDKQIAQTKNLIKAT